MQKSIRYIFLAAMVALLLFVLTSCNDRQAQPSEGEQADENVQAVTIDVLKIGKADSIIIDTGSEIIMIDTGEAEDFPTVQAYMEGNGYSKINKLILTHYDKDHIGAAAEIIRTYNVDTVYESRFTRSTEEYYRYHTVIAELGTSLVKLQEDFSFESGACKFEIFTPMVKKYATDNDNNQSLVVSVRYDRLGMLLLGDSKEQRLSELMEAVGEYDIVKLPHHGSYIENLSALLAKIKPTYAVATDSKKNPTDEKTAAELQMQGITLMQTRFGGIHIEFTSEGISVTQ